jgi:hypothetical protein
VFGQHGCLAREITLPAIGDPVESRDQPFGGVVKLVNRFVFDGGRRPVRYQEVCDGFIAKTPSVLEQVTIYNPDNTSASLESGRGD